MTLSVVEVRSFLLAAPHVADGGVSLMAALSALLRAQGFPLWRCSFSFTTKHPELVWRQVHWEEGAGVNVMDHPHATLAKPSFIESPVALLRKGSPPIRQRLTNDAPTFPICEELRARGATDYFAQGLPGSNGEICYASWASRDPAGFSEEDLAALVELTPYFAQRIELESAYHATRALLQVYLGRNAGSRVVDGDFRRGSGELIDAAIWFCDLRGFTELSDRAPAQDVVKTLDAYFECVAGAVMEAGGEVLKFVGDAILAIFPVEADPRAVCRRALLAAERALAALSRLNEERCAKSEVPIQIGIALHLGRVMYGNIGARDRLDFTVISASVNEACRLEALCKPLGTPLTMSEVFVAATGTERAVDLGLQALKGVSTSVRVFGLRSLISASESKRHDCA